MDQILCAKLSQQFRYVVFARSAWEPRHCTPGIRPDLHSPELVGMFEEFDPFYFFTVAVCVKKLMPRAGQLIFSTTSKWTSKYDPRGYRFREYLLQNVNLQRVFFVPKKLINGLGHDGLIISGKASSGPACLYGDNLFTFVYPFPTFMNSTFDNTTYLYSAQEAADAGASSDLFQVGSISVRDLCQERFEKFALSNLQVSHNQRLHWFVL